MTVPFLRRVSIQFDDLVYGSDYRLTFSVAKKSKGKNRNSAKIEIYNPDAARARAAIDRKGRRFVQIKAGYGVAGDPPILFTGYAVPDGAMLTRRGPDTILVVEAKGVGTGPSAKAAPKSFKIEEALTPENLLAAGRAAFDVALVYIEPAANIAQVGVRSLALSAGFSFTGSFEEYVKVVGDKLNADFSVEKGRAVFKARRRTQGNKGEVFSRDNGRLIEAPIPKGKGIVRFKFLLSSELEPGFRFIIEDDVYGGVYKVRSVVYSGDSGFSNNYYASVEGRVAPKAAGKSSLELEFTQGVKDVNLGLGRAVGAAAAFLSDPTASITEIFDDE